MIGAEIFSKIHQGARAAAPPGMVPAQKNFRLKSGWSHGTQFPDVTY
jgi:hypothetical protein